MRSHIRKDGYMKLYQVIIQDERNNLFHIGFYENLKDSVNDINDHLHIYEEQISKDDLREYPSTFGECFDMDLGSMFEDNDSIQGVMIRGFIFDSDYIRQ